MSNVLNNIKSGKGLEPIKAPEIFVNAESNVYRPVSEGHKCPSQNTGITYSLKDFLYELKGALWALSTATDDSNFAEALANLAEGLSLVLDKMEDNK